MFDMNECYLGLQSCWERPSSLGSTYRVHHHMSKVPNMATSFLSIVVSVMIFNISLPYKFTLKWCYIEFIYLYFYFSTWFLWCDWLGRFSWSQFNICLTRVIWVQDKLELWITRRQAPLNKNCTLQRRLARCLDFKSELCHLEKVHWLNAPVSFCNGLPSNMYAKILKNLIWHKNFALPKCMCSFFYTTPKSCRAACYLLAAVKGN